MNFKKRRIIYLGIAVLTAIIGLSTRKLPHLFPGFVTEYGGDTLWATLFFFLMRIVCIKKKLVIVALLTYGFGVLIEVSQLYQAPWINEWRQTFIGQMLLGHGFLWSDLVCYAVGVVLGLLMILLIEKSTNGQ